MEGLPDPALAAMALAASITLLHISRGDLVSFYGGDAVAVKSFDMAACNAHIHRTDVALRHDGGFIHGMTDGLPRWIPY